WPQSTRIVQLKRRPTSNVDSMMVLRARRGGTGSKYVTLRGGLRRAIPFLLVRSDVGAPGPQFYATKRCRAPTHRARRIDPRHPFPEIVPHNYLYVLPPIYVIIRRIQCDRSAGVYHLPQHGHPPRIGPRLTVGVSITPFCTR